MYLPMHLTQTFKGENFKVLGPLRDFRDTLYIRKSEVNMYEDHGSIWVQINFAHCQRIEDSRHPYHIGKKMSHYFLTMRKTTLGRKTILSILTCEDISVSFLTKDNSFISDTIT